MGRVFSVDGVRDELLGDGSREDRVCWEREEVPEVFFVKVDTDSVVRAHSDIVMWVQRHPRCFESVKAKFATGADGWLVAYARVHGSTVVTNERSAPKSRRDVKLPDLCEQFSV